MKRVSMEETTAWKEKQGGGAQRSGRGQAKSCGNRGRSAAIASGATRAAVGGGGAARGPGQRPGRRAGSAQARPSLNQSGETLTLVAIDGAAGLVADGEAAVGAGDALHDLGVDQVALLQWVRRGE